MRPSELLNHAKAELFERGWTQYTSESVDGSVCSVGALRYARFGTLNHPMCREDFVYQRAVACLMDATEAISIPTWNDTPGRRFSEVIDAFDRAEKDALIWEEGGHF